MSPIWTGNEKAFAAAGKATQPRLSDRPHATYLIDIIDGAIRCGRVFCRLSVC
jgi:hypothetical protein